MWCPPFSNFFKINFDGAYVLMDKFSGIGAVVRGCRGEFLGAFSLNLRKYFDLRLWKLWLQWKLLDLLEF